jgi:hypothetical protein
MLEDARRHLADYEDQLGRDVGVELVETIASPRVTHVRYAVHKP